MRKLFVLFLLVALVPFTVGCNGLWDFDDDSDTVLVKGAAAVVKPVVKVPAALAANVRAAMDAFSVPFTYNGVEYFPATVTTETINGVNYSVLTYGEIPVAANLFTNSNTTTISGTVSVGGLSIPVTLSVSILTTSTTATAVNIKSVLIAENDDGDLVVTVPGETQDSEPQVIPANAQYIVSVKYGETKVSTSESAPTEVTTLTPAFAVEMNSDVTAVNSWEVKVTNLTTNVSFTLSNLTDAAQFAVNAANKTVTINVNGTGKTLDNNSKYSIEFLGGTITPTAEIAGSAKRYIEVKVQ